MVRGGGLSEELRGTAWVPARLGVRQPAGGTTGLSGQVGEQVGREPVAGG